MAMRKKSQDGGDSTSITSGIENEIKKPSAAIIKNKRSSIKRKVQTLSHESDDAVSEPLLQKEKEKPETVNQSAKFSMLKSKTDAVHGRDSDTDKLLPDNKAKTSGLQNVSRSSSTEENILFKSEQNTTVPIHNHMNINVFSSIDTTKFVTATKNQILVEIDGCKQIGYNPSPLIFTTAKIHTDSKTKQMEPVQVTAVPILSTTEIANTAKASSTTSIVQAIPGTSHTKDTDKRQNNNSTPSATLTAGTSNKYSVPKTTSEIKLQNTLADRAVILSNSLSKDSTKSSVDTAKSKVSKSVTNKFEDNLTLSHDINKVGDTLKNDYLTKTSQSPLSHHKDVKTVNTLNMSKLPSTISGNMTGTSRISKTEDFIGKFDKAIVDKDDMLKHEGAKIDENANANTVAVQQPVKSTVLGIKKSPVDSKKISDVISKDIGSFTGNRQLPRQKNTVVEEIDDILIKSKPPNSESSSYNNHSKYSTDSVGGKFMTQSKMSDRGANDVIVKTLPNSGANNVTDTMTTKVAATSITSKPTLTFTSTIKSTVTESPHCRVITASVCTTTNPTCSKIPSNDPKITTIIIPSTTSATISSKPQTTSTTPPLVTPHAVHSKLSTYSTTMPSDTSTSVQAPPPNKINAPSSVKPISENVPLLPIQLSTTTSIESSPASASIKLSTVKSATTSSVSTPSTTKSITTQGAKSSASNKKKSPKTNEVNKDNKGLKT